MLVEDYYRQYILSAPTEGLCLTCGKRCSFVSLRQGYVQKYCSVKCCHVKGHSNRENLERHRVKAIKEAGNGKVCSLCGMLCSGFPGLATHVVNIHKMSSEDYYNEYLVKDPSAGTCPLCSKPTRFDSMGRGYVRYCGRKCAANSPEHIAAFSAIFRGKTMSREEVQKRAVTISKRMQVQYELTGRPTTSDRGFTTAGLSELVALKEIQKICDFQILNQHAVAGCYIDGYIKEINLAIEFDETAGHSSIAEKEHDTKREAKIKEAVPGITFFRICQRVWEENQELVLEQFSDILRDRKSVV